MSVLCPLRRVSIEAWDTQRGRSVIVRAVKWAVIVIVAEVLVALPLVVRVRYHRSARYSPRQGGGVSCKGVTRPDYGVPGFISIADDVCTRYHPPIVCADNGEAGFMRMW